MNRDELLEALNKMFPEGIPDSCSEVLARADAPFTSYQELRKMMGRSPAYTNRSNWIAVVRGDEGGDINPPKSLLKDLITNSTLIGFTGPQLMAYNTPVSELFAVLELAKLNNPELAKSTLTEDSLAPIQPAIDNNLPTNVITLRSREDPSKDVVDVTVSRIHIEDLLGTTIEDVFIDEADWDSTNLRQVGVDAINAAVAEIGLKVELPNAMIDTVPTDDWNGRLVVADYNYSNLVYGTLAVNVKKNQPKLELAFSWKGGKDTLEHPGDSTELLVGVVSGSLGELSPILSLGGNESIVGVSTYDPATKSFTLNSEYTGTVSDIVIKPQVIVGNDNFNNITDLTLKKQGEPEGS